MTRAARIARADPQLVLAAGAAAVVLLEGMRGSATLGSPPGRAIAQALVAGCALALAFRWRDRLRLRPLLGVALAFHLAWVGTHLAVGVEGDFDAVDLYPRQGQELLDGDYPRSEYPPGAVALFAFETLIGGGRARVPNAFLMIPFQLLTVAAIWSLRTRWTAWLAAFVAFWPLNAFYWEFRFDLIPACAVVAGVLLARRDRWWESGVVLALGTLVKWTPGLVVLALLVWLLTARRVRTAAVHLLGFAAPLLAVYVPLLLWKPTEVLAAYTTQGARAITAESFVFLPLHFFGDAEPGFWYFGAADVSSQANTLAIWLQIACVLAVLLLVARARARSAGLALAALMPVVFLLTNRVFSPQFFVLLVAALAVAAALTVRRSGLVLAVAGACAVASTANTVLFQSYLGSEPSASLPGWTLISLTAFLPVVIATAGLVLGVAAPPTPSLAEARASVAGRLRTGMRPAPVLAVLAIAGAYGLLRGVLAARFPPFLDEGIYAGWTDRIDTGAADAFVALASGKEPLLTWIAALFMKVGIGALTAGKLVSLLAGAVTLVVVALLASELAGRAAGVAAAALYAFVPFAVVHEQLGLMEPLLTATMATALLLQLRMARSERFGVAVLLGIVLAAGLLTKRSGELAIALLPLSLAAFPWREADVPGRLLRWSVRAATAVAIALLGGALLRLSDLYDTYLVVRDQLGSFRPLRDGLADPLRWTGENLEPFTSTTVDYATPGLLLLALVGLIAGLRTERGRTLVVAGWVAVPFAAAVLLATSPFPRYLLPALPPLVVLAGMGVGRLWEQRRPVAIVVGVVAVLWAAAVDARILRDPSTARYPGLDDWQFVTGWPAGNAWLALERELPRLRPGGTTVGYYDNFSGAIALRMQDRPYEFVRGEDAPWAPLVVENGAAPADTGVGELRRIRRFPRPRGGTPIVLHERGVRVGGTFATTPDRLRAALGLSDAGFDAWLEGHPRAFAWYHAWYEHVEET